MSVLTAVPLLIGLSSAICEPKYESTLITSTLFPILGLLICSSVKPADLAARIAEKILDS